MTGIIKYFVMRNSNLLTKELGPVFEGATDTNFTLLVFLITKLPFSSDINFPVLGNYRTLDYMYKKKTEKKITHQ